MTLYLNLSSLVWAALAALFVARYLDSWITRLIDVHERMHASNAPEKGEYEPMPPDLMGYVHAISTGNAEMDGVLQEQTLSMLHEQYAIHGNWDAVRAWSATNLTQDTRADGWGNS